MQIVKARNGAVVLLMALAFGLAACVQSNVDEGKIPITTNSKEARELFVQGRLLNDKLRVLDARPLLEKAVELDTNFAQAHWQLSLVQPSAAGFFDCLSKARATASHASEGEQLLIQATDAGVNGESPKQEEILKRLVQAFPLDERAHNQLGNFYFGQQRWTEAIAAYEESIELDSSYSQPYNQMGYAYRFIDRFDKAEQAFQQYIALIPDDPNPYDSYAELLLKMGRFEESITQYERALRQKPTFASSFIGIATNLDLLGRHEDARARLQQFYTQAADDGQRRTILGSMAVSYIDEGNFEAALGEIQKLYDIASAHGDYSNMSGDVNFMGNVLLQMGNFDEALKRFEESVALQEKADNVSEQVKELARFNHQYDAGRVAAWKGDLTKAKELWTAYRDQAELNHNPFQIWQAHQLGGIIALQEKNWDEAIAQLNQSNQQNPFNLWLLSEAYRGKGEIAQADELANKAVNYNAVGNVFQSFARRRVAAMPDKA